MAKSSSNESNNNMMTVNVIGNISSIDRKLDGLSNYSSWKFNIKMALIGLDLWECVTIKDADYSGAARIAA